MDVAYEIAEYLQTAGFGTLGTSIFVDQIGGETDGIYVESLGGESQNYLPIDQAVLNIYAKNTSAATAKAQLRNIKNHIHRMHNTVTANAYIYSILAIGGVENVDRDLEYAKLYKLTISVMCRDLGLIS